MIFFLNLIREKGKRKEGGREAAQAEQPEQPRLKKFDRERPVRKESSVLTTSEPSHSASRVRPRDTNSLGLFLSFKTKQDFPETQ